MFGFSPFATAPFASLGSVSVTVSVTGVSATVSVGNVVAGVYALVNVTGV
jgi:hypothetical protein